MLDLDQIRQDFPTVGKNDIYLDSVASSLTPNAGNRGYDRILHKISS